MSHSVAGILQYHSQYAEYCAHVNVVRSSVFLFFSQITHNKEKGYQKMLEVHNSQSKGEISLYLQVNSLDKG